MDIHAQKRRKRKRETSSEVFWHAASKRTCPSRLPAEWNDLRVFCRRRVESRCSAVLLNLNRPCSINTLRRIDWFARMAWSTASRVGVEGISSSR
jgi:hypothetical protein